MINFISNLLIGCGALVMGVNIVRFARLKALIGAMPAEVFQGRTPRAGLIMVLLCFFLSGYLFVLAGNLAGFDLGVLLVALIFFFGAIFVLFSVLFQYSTTRLLQEYVSSLTRDRSCLVEVNAALQEEGARSRRTLEALQSSELRFRQLAAASFEGIIICTSTEILEVNDSLARILRCEPITLIGRPPEDLVHDTSTNYFSSKLRDDDGLPFECLGRRMDGTAVTLEVRRKPMEFIGQEAMVIAVRDVSDRKAMEDRLRHEAMHDPLTGLANRSLLLDRLRLAMARSMRRENNFYGVVFVGIDRFKVVNDSLGHALGDKLLCEMAQRIAKQVRDFDTVARFGGDEFILLLEECPPKLILRIVKRIQAAIKNPFVMGNHSLQISASFGILLGPASGFTPEQMLQNANLALQRAKSSGRNRFKVFRATMLDRALEIMNLENDIRRGIENREFVLYYQPVVELRKEGDCLCGFEALIRWRHPVKGFVSPGEFIPLAEEMGLINELGRYVLEDACRELACWMATAQMHCGRLHLAVNLSAMQIGQPGIIPVVRQILEETGVPPEHLTLEITESAVMHNPQAAMNKIAQFKKLGVGISIDDFGTGYSSLAYLERFPADVLKIDRSFIRRMESRSRNSSIVSAIIQLAHSLGMRVVAEGVEEREQLDMLRELGCDAVQGYFYSPPVPADEARAMLIKPALLEKGR